MESRQSVRAADVPLQRLRSCMSITPAQAQALKTEPKQEEMPLLWEWRHASGLEATCMCHVKVGDSLW